MTLTIRRRNAVALVALALSLPLYVFLPTQVGLNGDLERYGADGILLLCDKGQRVWANYKFEPLFVTLLLGFSKAWGGVTGAAANCGDPGAGVYWLPISFSALLILVQAFAVRHLGVSALCFHLAFCLDTVLLMLPFNLLRQFAAVVVIVTMVALLLRDKVGPPLFVGGLVVAALIHWSAWLLVLVSVGAMAYGRLRQRVSLPRSGWAGRLLLIAAVLAGGYLLATVVLPRFMIAVLGPRGIGLSLESSVRGLVSPVTMAILLFVAAIGYAVRPGFLRTFLVGAAALYAAVAITGNVIALERLRALVLPIVYLSFLHFLRDQTIRSRWQVFNVLFLLFVVLNASRYSMIVRPFADRPSFVQLFK